MAVAKKDDNGYPTIIGISCVDGVTPVKIQINPASGGIKRDTTTVISFTPSPIFTHKDDNDYPISKGVSSTNGNIILPFYVNPATGALLTDE